MKLLKTGLLVILGLALVGCSTTNSNPYKASTTNVLTVQAALKPTNAKLQLGNFALANGVTEELLCRMLGPVNVAPGKKLTTFIKESFQEELFLAQVYDPQSSNVINGRIEKLAFSSVSPANWEITMNVSSNNSPGYQVAVKYNYDTSFDAWSACKNVADAFSPAVQELLRQVVSSPQFTQLVK